MSAAAFSPCESHQGLHRMEFYRALDIANECPFCYVEVKRDNPFRH